MRRQTWFGFNNFFRVLFRSTETRALRMRQWLNQWPHNLTFKIDYAKISMKMQQTNVKRLYESVCIWNRYESIEINESTFFLRVNFIFWNVRQTHCECGTATNTDTMYDARQTRRTRWSRVWGYGIQCSLECSMHGMGWTIDGEFSVFGNEFCTTKNSFLLSVLIT